MPDKAQASLQLVDRKPPREGFVATLPDECWLSILTNLEATELSGSTSALCCRLRKLAEQRDLWQALLKSDFCASFTQRTMLLAWMAVHQHFHPRQLYIFKRREHLLDLDIARAEMQQRGDQAREQERKQRRLRILNYVLVRITHLLLCASILSSSVLLWLRVARLKFLSFYVIFAPFFVFECFLWVSGIVTLTIYFQRSTGGWTFYWNRLQGAIRWFILYTSPCEGIIVLVMASAVAPLAACTLERDLLLPWPALRFLPPFCAFWLAGLCLAWSVVRRRACSSSCIGSSLLLWLPLAAFSILFFMRVSVVERLPPELMFLPIMLVTSILIVFASFLSIASFWLGWRGNRDWMEYATTTLVAVLAILLPMLLVQLALVGYLKGNLSVQFVFIPWTLWTGGLLLFVVWQSFVTLRAAPTVPIDSLPRYWRQGQDTQSDSELLLPPPVNNTGGPV
eukprot:TRINITY_DN43211_c0_g1_i1.p1 TRINITY_DN43211_c0_g1~~TRINITY_DN43211_c0_g1_i1.p1  ORF type:complete len:466 (-),score=63.01 TRINITY_DN43211_c0_g1_i1:33-1391(-)